MTSLSSRIALFCAVALSAGFGSAAAQTQPDMPIPTPEAYKASLPSDVYPETGNRFPKAKREELDDRGKKLFDALPANSRGGPGSVRIYSPPVAEAMSLENDYLRNQSGMDPQIKEMAILVTVRSSTANTSGPRTSRRRGRRASRRP